MIGAAFRVAMALGLHTNQSGKAYSQLEREMRLRVWYPGVFIFD